MSQRAAFVPPPLFTLGLGLTGGLQLVLIGISLFATLCAALGIGAAAVSMGGADGLAAIAFGGIATGALLLVMVAYSLFFLLACTKAWQGSRAWTYTVMLLTAIGFANPGCLSTPIGILTLIGCIQALETSRDQGPG